MKTRIGKLSISILAGLILTVAPQGSAREASPPWPFAKAGQASTRQTSEKKGAIAGTVVDAAGLPARGAEITVYTRHTSAERDAWQLGEVWTVPGAGTASAMVFHGDSGDLAPLMSRTDELGRYRVENLHPGEYYVAVQMATDRAGASGPSRLPAAEGPYREIFVPVFYPDTIDVTMARAIYVPAAGEIRDINLKIRPTLSAIVKGSVVPPVENNNTRAGAAGAAVARVGLFPSGPGSDLRRQSRTFLTAGADGIFQFNGVAPGPYKVVAIADQADRHMTAIQNIEVKPGSAETLTMNLQWSVDLAGQVILDRPIPPNFFVGLTIREHFDGLKGFETWNLTGVGADGSFVIRNALVGTRYGVTYSGTSLPNGYVSAARYGANDVDCNAFTVRPEEARLQIQLESAYGRVEIGATDGGRPREGLLILLAPRDRGCRGAYQSAVSNRNGAVTFDRVIPGDYVVFALEGADQDSRFDQRFMEKLEGRGRPVHVEKNATVRETAPVIRLDGSN